MAGTLFVVATPIGNLEDITVRALRVLREVALIGAEDTRRTAHLLARYGITTPMTSLHEHNEHRKSSALVGRLQRGESIALVSDAGTPAVSDPGRELVSQAVQAGVRVEAIPGPSAVVALVSVSGMVSDSFLFLGFPPIKAKDRSLWFERLKAARGMAVFYEAPHRILSTLQRVQEEVGDVPVVIGRELTKAHEELVRGPISTVLQGGITPKGEFVVGVYIGQSANNSRVEQSGDAPDQLIMADIGRMTTDSAGSKRQALAAIARKYGISTRHVYKLAETRKSSGG